MLGYGFISCGVKARVICKTTHSTASTDSTIGVSNKYRLQYHISGFFAFCSPCVCVCRCGRCRAAHMNMSIVIIYGINYT